MGRWRIWSWFFVLWCAFGLVFVLLDIQQYLSVDYEWKEGILIGLAGLGIIWPVGAIFIAVLWAVTRPRDPASQAKAKPSSYAVSRRTTPENIAAAHRALTRVRLAREGVSPERADAWVDAWMALEPREVARQDAAYWQAGWDWIAAQRQRRDP